MYHVTHPIGISLSICLGHMLKQHYSFSRNLQLLKNVWFTHSVVCNTWASSGFEGGRFHKNPGFSQSISKIFPKMGSPWWCPCNNNVKTEGICCYPYRNEAATPKGAAALIMSKSNLATKYCPNHAPIMPQYCPFSEGNILQIFKFILYAHRRHISVGVTKI
jgi:hypothetical protein